jgi:hypothetical protein
MLTVCRMIEELAPIVGLAEALHTQHLFHVSVINPHIGARRNRHRALWLCHLGSALNSLKMFDWIAAFGDSEQKWRLLSAPTRPTPELLPRSQEAAEHTSTIAENGQVAIIEEGGLIQKPGIPSLQIKGNAEQHQVLDYVSDPPQHLAIGGIRTKILVDAESVCRPKQA